MISIIVPVFNPGEQLEFLLECVKSQTEEDFEVLLIDDGSTDGSGKICDQFEKKDNRFHVVHQCNRGVAVARNCGISEAKGEYIVFLDADDEIPLDYLQKLLETQRETKADIVVCDVVIIQDGQETGRFTHEPCVLEQKQALNLLLSRRKINSGPCAKLFCRRILQQAKFPAMKVYEDILFVRDAFVKAEMIAVTNRTEYRYIQNNGSAMHQNSKGMARDIIKATDSIAAFICKHSELEPYCFYITISHMMQYMIPLIHSGRNKDIPSVYSAKKLLRKYKWKIIKCRAFPWKEKVLFLWYAYKCI